MSQNKKSSNQTLNQPSKSQSKGKDNNNIKEFSTTHNTNSNWNNEQLNLPLTERPSLLISKNSIKNEGSLYQSSSINKIRLEKMIEKTEKIFVHGVQGWKKKLSRNLNEKNNILNYQSVNTNTNQQLQNINLTKKKMKNVVIPLSQITNTNFHSNLNNKPVSLKLSQPMNYNKVNQIISSTNSKLFSEKYRVPLSKNQQVTSDYKKLDYKTKFSNRQSEYKNTTINLRKSFFKNNIEEMRKYPLTSRNENEKIKLDMLKKLFSK
jgi:hypothetical protein